MLNLGFGAYFLLAAVAAFVVGWFWQSRGLNLGWGFAGTIAAALVGPVVFRDGSVWSVLFAALVAFIVGFLIRPNVKAKDEHQLADGQAKKCPLCAELIKAEAIVCRYCGRDVPKEAALSAEVPAPGASQECARFCSACEAPVGPDDRICPSCGNASLGAA